MALTAAAPAVLAKSELLEVSRSDKTILLSGRAAEGKNVTLRCAYLGEEKPNLPDGADGYRLTDVSDIKYFNVVSGNAKGEYSASFEMTDYGYYVVTAVSEDGERQSRLYRYKKLSQGTNMPGDAKRKYSDKSRIFEAENTKLVLLNMTKDETAVIPYSDCGVSDGAALDGYVENIASKLPEKLGGYVTGAELSDGEYNDIIGAADEVGIYGNGRWRILKADADSRDAAKYESGVLNKGDDGLSAENLVISDSSVTAYEKNGKDETIAEFTAPETGSYSVNLGLHGAGELKAKVTALTGEKVFDNYSLISTYYKGEEISKTAEVDLSAGDRIFLHLYPPVGEVGIDFSINCGGKSYSLSELAGYENMCWTSGVSESGRYAYSLNSADLGKVYKVSENERFFVRPIVYINTEYFRNNKINIDTAGADVLAALEKNFSRDSLGIYDKFELNTIFNEYGGFSYEFLGYTDGDGNSVTELSNGTLNTSVRLKNTMRQSKDITVLLAAYSKDGYLLAANKKDVSVPGKKEENVSLGINLTGVSAGAYAKIFLWSSAEEMMPISEIKSRDKLVSRLADAMGAEEWSFYTRPVGGRDFSQYSAQTPSGSLNIQTASTLPWVQWRKSNADNKAYIRPEKTGEQVIAYTVPQSGNWKVELTYKNVGVGETYGGDGGSLYLSYLPKGDNDDSRTVRSLHVNVSSETPAENSYSTVIEANGGDRIMLAANAGTDGYGDYWEINYTISETDETGKKIGDGYKTVLPQDGTGSASAAAIADNIVWIGVDGNFGDSDAMKTKIMHFKKFVPNLGVILMSNTPDEYCNAKFFEENNIPVIVQSYGAGFESYIASNNAWEWDWNSMALDSSHWQDMSGTAHAFALPHYATKEVFSSLAKSSATSGYSGFGFPDYVWMWGARGISGYNPETIKAFRDDLSERDSGLLCDDGVWYFHDYYRYYTGSSTLILPSDVGLDSWEEYTPLSQSKNTELNNAGTNTDTYWALFDMLCHYEWLKFAQYISNVSAQNGGITQIMINPEYYPDGVDYVFLNKLKSVYMTEDEYFGNTDYLDGAYYRSGYLTKGDTKTGGVMEAGGGGNGGAYYTNEIAYLTAFELGMLKNIDHLETDFMYQNSGFSAERDGQIMSYAKGFSDAKTLNFDRNAADFTVVSSRNQSRPWAENTEWRPWSLRLGYDNNIDFYLAKLGYNFDGISQEGIDSACSDVIVFSPHKVTQSAWNKLVKKVKSGKTGIISALRLKKAVNDKMQNVAFSDIAPEYSYSVKDIGLAGNVRDKSGNNVTTEKIKISGGIATALPGDETLLSFKTLTKAYPILVKRQVSDGEMYILLFDDSANYEIANAVYKYLFDGLGIKQSFVSVENSGTLTDGFTATDSYNASVAADLGASARIYQSGELTAVGIQNSLARRNASSSLTSTGACAPYEISGRTEIKALMQPNREYKYIAVPSMQSGSVAADSDGYVSLSFENTSHEIFFMLPKESTRGFDDITKMQSDWKKALEF